MNTSRTHARPAFLGTVAAAFACAIFSTAACADTVKVMLSGDAEVPPVKTMASGSGTVTINPDMSVGGGFTTAGLNGTMAHIHLGAAGKNGPVVITFARKGDNDWAVPDGAKLTEAQYQAYKAGELYINVHTADNKAGEIRGQLMP